MGISGACVAKCGYWAWHKHVLGLHGWRGEGAEPPYLLALRGGVY